MVIDGSFEQGKKTDNLAPLLAVSILAMMSLLACISTGSRDKTSKSLGLSALDQKELIGKLEKKYSKQTYMRAWGTGGDLTEAIMNAKAQIAEEISSSLSADAQSNRSIINNVSSEKLVINVATRSEFKHAALISPISESSFVAEGRVNVMVVLAKKDFGDTISKEYTGVASRFRVNAEKSMAHGQKRDRAGFCSIYPAVVQDYETLKQLDSEWYAVYRSRPKSFSDDQKAFNSAVAFNASLNLERAVTVSTVGLALELRGPVVEKIFQELSQGAIPALEGKSCRAGILFEISGRVSCDSVSLGYRCMTALSGLLRDCQDPGVILDRVQIGMVSGMHPSDESSAKRRLISNLAKQGFKIGPKIVDLTSKCGEVTNEQMLSH